jgi:HD-GYP domain-containing protein (c-di-GMP phosphodiesterase class II)
MLLAAGNGAGTPAFSRSQRMYMSFVADVASVAVSGLLDRKSLEQHYVDTMTCLMETVEAKDSYTRGHTERVVEYSLALGRRICLSHEDLDALRQAAALHDIGKIGVPDAIILKPGRLDADEYAVMKEHPGKASKILQNLRFLGLARMVVRAHHERYDGKGYPDGLTGEEIPLGARILAIADTYDAMTSTRPYRKAMSADDALAEIAVNAGRQFDPALAAQFVMMMRESQEQHIAAPAAAGAGAKEN